MLLRAGIESPQGGASTENVPAASRGVVLAPGAGWSVLPGGMDAVEPAHRDLRAGGGRLAAVACATSPVQLSLRSPHGLLLDPDRRRAAAAVSVLG